MRLKKLFCPLFALTLLVICLSTGVKAQEVSAVVDDEVVSRATSQFTIEVPANGIRYASTQFPMEVGEVVTIRASYSPANVDVNFGLIDSDSIFHYVTATG